jgi:hypothetical protein
VGLKLNGTHQLLVYADDVNRLEDNIDTVMIWGCVTVDGVWIGWLNLLTPSTYHSELQAITALSLISTLYNSLLHPLVSLVYYSLHFPFPGNGFQQSNYTSLTVTAGRMKCSLHSLIPFFSVIFDCQFKRLPQFYCSAPKLICWQLDSSANYLQDNSSARTMQKTQLLYCCMHSSPRKRAYPVAP